MLIAPQDVSGSRILLRDARQLHHARDVLRLKEGDRVICVDGAGAEYTGVVAEHRAGALRVAIEQHRAAPQERVSFWLAQALLKADRFEWVVQKATELGVARISPLLTERSVVRVPEGRRAAKHQRWQRIVQEAAKQCGRATVPAVEPPMTLDEYAPQLHGTSLALIPTLETEATPLEDMLRKPPQPLRTVALLIGPEGDFTREEVELTQRHGARAVSLGHLTLRAETAAIATLAMLRYALHVL